MLLLIKNPLNAGYLVAVYDTGINLLKTTINGLEILAGSEKSLKVSILAAREFGYI